MPEMLHCTAVVCFALVVAGCGGEGQTPAAVSMQQPGIAAGGKGPIAEFQDVVLDLGDVPLHSNNDSLDAVIRVKNAGDEPLAFQRLVMSCGCTAATPAQQQIEAGETGSIDLRISVTTSGSRTVSVTLHSNTIGRSWTTVNIRWNAVAPIEVEPEEINFGGIAPGTSLQTTVHLVQSKFGECAASQVAVDPAFQAQNGVSAEWQEPLKLNVSLKAGDKPGHYLEFVPLTLTDCWRDSIRIPVRWEVKPLVSMMPAILFVGTVAPGDKVSRPIVVTTTESRLELGSPTAENSESSAVNATLAEWRRIDDSRLIGSVELTAPDTPGAFHTTLTIPVQTPEFHHLELRVSGYVKVSSL